MLAIILLINRLLLLWPHQGHQHSSSGEQGQYFNGPLYTQPTQRKGDGDRKETKFKRSWYIMIKYKKIDNIKGTIGITRLNEVEALPAKSIEEADKLLRNILSISNEAKIRIINSVEEELLIVILNNPFCIDELPLPVREMLMLKR